MNSMNKLIRVWFAVVCLTVFMSMAASAAVKDVGSKQYVFEEVVSMTAEWSAISDQDWISVQKTETGVEICVAANMGEQRVGKVQIVPAAAGVKKLTMKIRQAAYDPVLDAFKYDWMRIKKKDVTAKFLKKVVKIAKRLGVKPDDLMTVMAFESGLDHTAVNRFSGATGFIQFLPSTAAALGTSVSALKTMTAVKQLNYVEAYLKQFGTLRNLGDLYMAILWPKGVGQRNSYALWKSGTREYTGNRGLDVNNDGKVTRKECLTMVLRVRKQYVGE